MISFFTQNIGKYKKATIATPLFIAVEVFMEILIPFIAAKIVDDGISAGNMNAVITYGALMLICAFIALAMGIAAGRSAAIASAGFAANLRLRIFTKIQEFAFANIDKFSPPGLITRMTTDVTNVQNAFQMMIRICVRSPLMLICSVVMCFAISWKMSLIFLLAIVFLGVAFGLIIKYVFKYFRRVMDSYDDLNQQSQENITNIRVVKGFARENFAIQKFLDAIDRLYHWSVRAESIIAINTPILMSVIFGCIISLGWFGSNLIVAGEITTGNLTSMLSYIMSMMMSLMMIGMIFVMVTMSTASIERISSVLNEKPSQRNIDLPSQQPVKRVEDGSIDFESVNFAYREGMGIVTLWDINLHIESGQTIGIIGATGSGKSTLVSLISRLYDANTGIVKVGGVNVKYYDMKCLRNSVSVVLQNNVLFSGSIYDNLRWGNKRATEEECKEACKLACADEFISKLPDGYNTHIEQGGSNVSGGQRQRLCIARALLKKPKILILDDSTSAVDTATDAKIQRAFEQAIPGTTKIIISQRIASLQNADKIIVMDNGRINAFDTHENLLKSCDIYREINDVQLESGGDFDEMIDSEFSSDAASVSVEQASNTNKEAGKSNA